MTAGIVLASGAARGAYEAGVAQYLVEDVAREIGRQLPLDVLCGSSAGAANVCGLAALADDTRGRGVRLADAWRSLDIAQILKPDFRGAAAALNALCGHRRPRPTESRRAGGLVDPLGFERIIDSAIPFDRIGKNLKAGRFRALSVSTTHVRTGRTVIFVERSEPGLPAWRRDPTVVVQRTHIRPAHVIASAAMPMLFPPVLIDGDFYCDGGLSQNVPLSPAHRLGADRLVVVSPRHLPEKPPAGLDLTGDSGVADPVFLLGKAVNAILLDRIDNDIDRLNMMNDIIEFGARRYGPGYIDDLNATLGHPAGQGLRPIRTVLIRATQDLGRVAGDLVRSASFRKRVRGGAGVFFAWLAEGPYRREADLLSYLLFDREFAAELIELGRHDARAHHAALCALFSEEAAKRVA